MLNFKKIKMAFTAAVTNFGKRINPDIKDNQLTKVDLEILLTLIKNSSFKGGDLEAIYNLVTKLQNQYTEQS